MSNLSSLHLFPNSGASARASIVSWMLGGGLLLCGLTMGAVTGMSSGLQMPDIQALVVPLLIAPVVEELFFRGVMHEALLKRGVNALAAITVVSLLFALAHLWGSNVGHAVATAVPAFAIGILFHKMRKFGLLNAIAACAVLHSVFNAFWQLFIAKSVLNYVPWLY